MAASAAEKDYVHVVVANVARVRGKTPEFCAVNIADFERGPDTFDLQERLKDAIAFHADAVVVAIGENMPELTTEQQRIKWREDLVRLLALVRGDAELYVRSNFWANEPKDAVLREACETAGGNFVDIGSLSQKQRNYARSERMIVDTGVGSHPGDQGMRAIADAISAAMMK